jgi:hypothetical protein
MALQYLTDDLQGYLESARELESPLLGPSAELGGNLELGKVADAEKIIEENPAKESALFALLFGIAWHQAGDPAKASEWRQRAIVALETGDADSRRAAELLESTAAVTLDDLDDVVLPRAHKAALAIVLAAQHSEMRTELLGLVEKLNVPGLFPYRMLKRAIDAMKS